MGSVLDQKDTTNFNDFINFKFNLIFSDALHTPEGVWSEYKNIISENLDNEFILFFDYCFLSMIYIFSVHFLG